MKNRKQKSFWKKPYLRTLSKWEVENTISLNACSGYTVGCGNGVSRRL